LEKTTHHGSSSECFVRSLSWHKRLSSY